MYTNLGILLIIPLLISLAHSLPLKVLSGAPNKGMPIDPKQAVVVNTNSKYIYPAEQAQDISSYNM